MPIKIIILGAGGVIQPDSQAYKDGIELYPGAVELIRTLYQYDYQVVILTNNSDVGIQHTRELLAKNNLSCIPVYESADYQLSKPDEQFFLTVCQKENVSPKECCFIDDREENRGVATKLGMTVVSFVHPNNPTEAVTSLNNCRDELLRLNILRNSTAPFPAGFNRGMYPSLYGMRSQQAVKYVPEQQAYVSVDEPNEDGNPRKHCLYQSRLAQLIIEKGRKYFESGYQTINELFLADFELKELDPSLYEPYFDKVEKTLKTEKQLRESEQYTIDELHVALKRLFSEQFDLTNVSQFYYGMWLFAGEYGHEPLELCVFLVDELTKIRSTVSPDESPLLLLHDFPKLAHSEASREKAYLRSQPWLTCGPPQLRGRARRENAQQPPHSNTVGIVKDNDPKASRMPPHFAAKEFFRPERSHPISQLFQTQAGSIIGGSSGTLGRNIYMLAPLVESGLLSDDMLQRYVMGFMADLIYRGHHSIEEIIAVANQVWAPEKPWLDPIRSPIEYYEQLLTKEFIASPEYQSFVEEHSNFFIDPFNETYPNVSSTPMLK